jgi:5-methylcytosine-specific restriction endonuclease McrA
MTGRLSRSCTVCGQRIEGGASTNTSRCPTHQPARTHDDAEYRRNRRIALARDRERCTVCGKGPADGVRLEVDHVIPLALGGTHALKNLATVCEAHNPRGGQ